MRLSLFLITIGVLTFAELRFGARLDFNRFLNLRIWALKFGLRLALLPAVVLSVPFSLIDATRLGWAAGFATYFIAIDLGEYLFHRAQHAIPWMWRMHSLHHSDSDMNATTTERHFWGDQFLKAVTIWPATALIIRPTPAIVAACAVTGLWNYVAHSAVPLSFGRFSWLLNSPAYHRRHHSRLTEHYNSNFAALLPIWDVLFGSYHRPDGELPPTGLDRSPAGFADAAIWPIKTAAAG